MLVVYSNDLTKTFTINFAVIYRSSLRRPKTSNTVNHLGMIDSNQFSNLEQKTAKDRRKCGSTSFSKMCETL